MDTKDIASISVAKSFNRKWWESKRASKAKGSGTGAALDEWKTNCPNDVGKLTAAGLDAADQTCVKLRKGLQNAIAKCGKDQAETVLGAKKMMTFVSAYETTLAVRRKDVAGKGMATAGALADILTDVKGYIAALAPLEAELKLVDKRLALRRAEASAGGLTAAGKKVLIADLDGELTALDGIDRQLVPMSAGLKAKEIQIAPQMKAAREDGRMRPVLDSYKATTERFDKQYSIVYDGIMASKATVAEVRGLLVKTGDIDGALEGLKRLTEMLQFSPSLEVFGSLTDGMKTWTPKVMTFGKTPAKMTPENWKEVLDIEERFEGEWNTVDTRTRELDRMMKQIDEFARSWKGIVLVEAAADKARKAVDARTKERTTMMKIAPLFQAQLKALVAKQP